ncbi:MAG: DUF4293 domain-containing protein [Bacteroidia bacterium]
MIQRIQTLFLMVVVAVSVCLVLFPFVNYPNLFNRFTIGSFSGHWSTTWHYLAGGLNYMSMALSLICMFLFRNRMLQFRLANIIAVFNLALLMILLFADLIKVEEFLSGDKQILWPSYLPAISVACAFLAGRFIRKDEELVRSADRIR